MRKQFKFHGFGIGADEGHNAIPQQSEFGEAPLASFEEDPENPRTEFDDPEFEDFVKDVSRRGVMVPVSVIHIEGGRLRIKMGSRRYRAAVRLGLPNLRYVVERDPRRLTRFAQVAENQRRKGNTPLELAAFIQECLQEGYEKSVIAAELQISPSDLTYLVSLVDAPAFLLDVYRKGKCRQPRYFYELRLFHKKSPDLVELRCAGTEEINNQFLKQLAIDINSAQKQTLGTSSSKTRSRRNARSINTSAGPGTFPSSLRYENRQVTVIRVGLRFEDGSEEEIAGKALEHFLAAAAQDKIP